MGSAAGGGEGGLWWWRVVAVLREKGVHVDVLFSAVVVYPW